MTENLEALSDRDLAERFARTVGGGIFDGDTFKGLFLRSLSLAPEVMSDANGYDVFSAAERVEMIREIRQAKQQKWVNLQDKEFRKLSDPLKGMDSETANAVVGKALANTIKKMKATA